MGNSVLQYGGCSFLIGVITGTLVTLSPVMGYAELRFRSPEHTVECHPGIARCSYDTLMPPPTPTPSKSCPDVVKRAAFDAATGDVASLSFTLGDGAPGQAALSGEIEYVCSAGKFSEWRSIVARGSGSTGKGGYYTITPELSWSPTPNSRLLRIGLAPTPPKSNQNYISVRSPRVAVSEENGKLILSVSFGAGHGNHGWGWGEIEVRTKEIVDCQCAPQ